MAEFFAVGGHVALQELSTQAVRIRAGKAARFTPGAGLKEAAAGRRRK